MKRKLYAVMSLLVGALAGCAHMQPEPPPAVTQPPAQATPTPPAEIKAETGNARTPEEESQQLISMQKSYFNIFRIDEANIGLTARPNAIGVFDLQRPPHSDRIRLTVSLQAKKPVQISVGAYAVTLDTVVNYIEVQVCQSASCAGKRQRIVRSLSKVLQVQISPQNRYFGGKDFSLAEAANAEGKDRNYKSSYQDVVITVKRISVTPLTSGPA